MKTPWILTNQAPEILKKFPGPVAWVNQCQRCGTDSQLGEDEEYFGNFSAARFAWKLKNIRRIKNPPPIKGKQGLFDAPDELIKTLDSYDPI